MYGYKKVESILRDLEENWPDGLWIWSADGKLYLMAESEGKRAYTSSGGVDEKFVLDDFDIPSDGGDW